MYEKEDLKVEYSEYVLNFLRKADAQLGKRIIEKVDYLAKNFDKITHLALSYEFRDFFKLRVGKYRIIYTLDWKEKKLKIVLVDKREKVYKVLRRLAK